MKVSEYIAEFLAINGIRTVFGMSGGAILHTVDSLYHNKDIKVIFTTNEQFAAFEADGYARANGCKKPGVCFATSGPGATNLLTGIATSFFDSIPIIAFTGQVSRNRLTGQSNVRQFGFQEVNIIEMAKPISKGAFQPKDFEELKLLLPHAYSLAMSGRQGPVIIDLPDDLQRENIESYPSPVVIDENKLNINQISADKAAKLIFGSKKPLLLVGNGSRYSLSNINKFVDCINLPVVSTWAAIDVITSNKNYLGTVGTYSPLLNHFFDKCDLLISVGCRLSNNVIGSAGKDFAPQANKIIIDIDEYELKKLTRIGVNNVIEVHSDATTALVDILGKLKNNYSCSEKDSWWVKESEGEPIQTITPNNGNVNVLGSIVPLVAKISNIAFSREIDIYVDTGNTLAWVCNAVSKVSSRPKVFSSWNNTPMGYSLPAAIGASLSSPNRFKTTFCFIGDGGLSLCMSELALLSHHQLPIKVFVIENGGHNIQKQTIETWLSGRYAGVSISDGLAMPNFEFFNKVFGFETYVIDSDKQINDLEQKMLDEKPYLFRVLVDEKLRSFPIVPYGKKLTDPICLS